RRSDSAGLCERPGKCREEWLLNHPCLHYKRVPRVRPTQSLTHLAQALSRFTHDVVLAGPGLVYRRRNAALSAGVPMFHMLSAMLIVTPGGTIWSMRSSTSLDRSIPSAAR